MDIQYTYVYMYVKSLLMQMPVPTRPATVPIGFKFVQVMYAWETFGGHIGLAKMAGFVIPRWVFLHIRGVPNHWGNSLKNH